jgi:hypothetical protein
LPAGQHDEDDAMTGDPWLLVAQRHFQDMRQDAVGGERIAASSTGARRGRIGRLVERVGAMFQALRRQPADDLAAIAADDATPVPARLHGLG